MRRPTPLLLLALVLAACGTGERPPAANTTPPSANTATSAANTPPSDSQHTAPGRPTRRTRTANTPGGVVVLDAGHNGGNAGRPELISREVPAGRGRTKACNTTGTATDGGYPEHAFTFDVTRRVQRLLTENGIRVVLTRETDDGVGPCVHERARIGNESGAAAVVSIHADGSTDKAAKGFHIAYSAPPLNDAQGEPAIRLAGTMRDALLGAGFPLSTYLGERGLDPRDDLAGMNLSTRPSVLVECGNMRNPAEAAAMTTAEGRQRYAEAIAAGITSYLGG